MLIFLKVKIKFFAFSHLNMVNLLFKRKIDIFILKNLVIKEVLKIKRQTIFKKSYTGNLY